MVKVGDTIADILEGKNAGADMVIDSIHELPEAITALNMRMREISK